MNNKELDEILDQAAQDGQSILDLRGQGLTTLPPRIGQLTTLKELILDSNQLTQLPSTIGQLGNLVTLELGNNLLTMLPDEIGQLSSLTKLTLHTNHLSVLPSKIAQLHNLRLLGLGTNRLNTLPPNIGELNNLTDLYLDNNQLTTLPPEIGRLTNLNLLSLPGNPLTALPREIGQLTSLEYFFIDTIVPPEVYAQGAKASIAYLQKLEPQSAENKRWVAKLLVVGEAGVGKTATLRSLLGEPFQEPLDSTSGIEIRLLNVPHPTIPHVRMELNTWDFGGQVIITRCISSS